MSKLKVAIALGAGILGLTLLGDAKKASASPAPSVPPTPEPVPTPKPAGKPKRKTAPVPAELTAEQAQLALDQAWPLINAGRADRDTLTAALRWAQTVGDTQREQAILKLLGA